MNCRKASHLLSAYIDGELAGVEQLQVQQHLRDCGCCNAEYESLLATKRLLSGLSMKRPRPDLEDQILARLDRRDSAPGLMGLRAWWSVLTQQQQQHVRMLYLCSALCCASVLLAGTRIVRSLGSDAVSGTISGPGPIAAAPTVPGAGYTTDRRPQPDVPDILAAHSSWDAAEPFRPAPAVPAANEVLGPLDGPDPARSGP